ncbi:MAG: ECF transporter S component [Lachnospiraceae bacterium]|nr:ECF transporter S component [Lachnospiraceae bacterium]
MKSNSFWKLSAWKLKDVILASLIAVLFAFICFAVVHFVAFTLTPLLAPVGFGDLAMEFVFGIFFMSAVFAPYIIRKPGVATIVGTMTGVVQILMGSAFAATLLISAFVQGLGSEAAFAVFRYKKFNILTVILASLGATITSFILAWYRGSWSEVIPTIVILRFVIRALSACLFSGIISKLLADRLAKAGVLKSYPIGQIRSGNEPISD